MLKPDLLGCPAEEENQGEGDEQTTVDSSGSLYGVLISHYSFKVDSAIKKEEVGEPFYDGNDAECGKHNLA